MLTMCQMAQLMKKFSITFIHHHILSSHYCQPHLTSKETEWNQLPKVTKVEKGRIKIAIESVRCQGPQLFTFQEAAFDYKVSSWNSLKISSYKCYYIKSSGFSQALFRKSPYKELFHKFCLTGLQGTGLPNPSLSDCITTLWGRRVTCSFDCVIPLM